jgi:phosphonate transport system ATP-binding protein
MNGAAASPVISVTGVTKKFGTNRALHDVNLTVEPGEVVVLLGLSGSGKSTLLRHLDGLEFPTSGSVEVLGANVPKLRPKALRALRGRVGMIFQQFELVPSLTVLENVLTGALSRLTGPRLGIWAYPKSFRLAALNHLDRVGLLEKAYQRADQLSGGQQQRVAIARALMQNPEVLFADEPVASLDPESSGQIMRLIREIAADDGLTVVCSLHQVDLALDWCDRIVGLFHRATAAASASRSSSSCSASCWRSSRRRSGAACSAFSRSATASVTASGVPGPGTARPPSRRRAGPSPP